MPLYLLTELCHYLPAIEAAEQRAAVTVTSAPHAKAADYRALLRQLDAQARQLRPAQPKGTIEHIREDRDAAAAWFAAMGVKVEKRGG